MEVRGSVFGLEIFGSCRLEAVESPGIVHVLKLRAYLRRIDVLSRGSL